MKNPKKRIWQASEIWKLYPNQQPFAPFLKDYFKKNKKFGKKDRSELSDVLFSFLRIGNIRSKLDFDKSAVLGLLLNNSSTNETLANLAETFEITLPENYFSYRPNEKLVFCSNHFQIDIIESILPENLELSEGLNKKEIAQKVLRQSAVFIRIIKNQTEVTDALSKNQIEYKLLSDGCLRLAPDAKLNSLPSSVQKCFYIQDWASQKTIDYIETKSGELWWDVCSGSGGKSLLMLSHNPEIKIDATDIRKSTIHNYNNRLRYYGYTPNTKVLDIANSNNQIDTEYDGVVIDAPCSGSGVWGRAPEGMCQTSNKNINKYSHKQKAIISAAVKNLKPKGKLTYITCSIYKLENEIISEYISANHGLKLIKQGIIHRSDYNSDYLFAAQFIKK